MANRYSSTLISEAGLTLLEVMIAIVLLSFVMLGVVSITDNSRSTKDRTVRFNRDNLQIETVISRLEVDFAQIWSPLYFSQKFQGSLDTASNPSAVEIAYLYERHPRFRMPSKEGLPIPIFRSPEKTEFLFLTMGNRRKIENQPQSNFMWVRYYLGDAPPSEDPTEEKNPKATGKALMRQVFPDDPWSKEEFDFENTRGQVLLEDVEELEFGFWNMQTRKWETNLLTIADGQSLQRGLQMTVSWYDSEGHKRELVHWFRPLWPPVVPNDQPTPTAPSATTGGQPGGASGSSTGTTTNGGNIQ